MFTHPSEINEFEKRGARKIGIIIPPATCSGKQIFVMLLILASLILFGLYLFK